MRVPIQEYLVPDVLPAPSVGATRVRESITRGLPHRVVLERDLALLLVAPTGLALTWRDAQPDTLLSSHLPELATLPVPETPRIIGATDRLAARLLVLRGQEPLAAIPLALGVHRVTPDDGDAASLLELWVLGWDLRAGNMRGPGDYGAFIELAWRAADGPSETFSQPPVHPAVAEREPDLAYQSELG